MQFRRGTLNLRSGCHPAHFQEKRMERALPDAVFPKGVPRTLYGIQPKNGRVQQSQDWLRFTVTN